MTKVKEIWIIAEIEDGQIAPVSLELMGKGLELAAQRDGILAVVLLGDQAAQLGETLFAHGAAKVYLADDAQLTPYTTLPYAEIITGLVKEYQPEIVLYGATPMGRDLAPRIASALQAGLTADCTDLQIGDYTTGGKDYQNKLLQIRPAFGGNIIATIVSPDALPQMATVREGVMIAPTSTNGKTGEVVRVPVTLSPEAMAVKVLEQHHQERRVDLKAAQVIVAGGYGMGAPDNFKLLHELAELLGGAVGASRAAVDAGMIHHDHQVGQTGTTVRPRLYIACGISGAVQHRAGMEESQKILAINTDAEAPIFKVAHYGIIGDASDVLPRMIKAIQKKL